MMILISGQPGNGKSLRAMALMEEEYHRNREAVKAGREQPRRFFSNVKGSTRFENPAAFEWVEPMPDDNDWRKLPDGSYVLYDEAHSDGATEGLERYGLLFPTTGKPGEASDPRIKAMSTHRHRGFDLVFMTQWPNKVHHTLRTLVGKHIHMNRAMGLQRAGMFTWTRVQADPYDEAAREKADEEIWVYPSGLYDKYVSATLHTSTYKFKVPKKVWASLSTVVAVVVVGWASWAYLSKAAAAEESVPEEKTAGQAEAPLGAGGPPSSDRPVLSKADYLKRFSPRVPGAPWSAPIYDDTNRPAVPPKVACMIGATCHCMTDQGTKYLLPQNICRRIVRNGGVLNPFQSAADQRVQGVQPPAAMAAPAAASAVVGIGEVASLQAPYGSFRSEPVTVSPADGF